MRFTLFLFLLPYFLKKAPYFYIKIGWGATTDGAGLKFQKFHNISFLHFVFVCLKGRPKMLFAAHTDTGDRTLLGYIEK